MRTKKAYVRTSIEKSLHAKLIKDRDKFNEQDSENKWSLSDTIEEHRRIAQKN